MTCITFSISSSSPLICSCIRPRIYSSDSSSEISFNFQFSGFQAHNRFGGDAHTLIHFKNFMGIAVKDEYQAITGNLKGAKLNARIEELIGKAKLLPG